MKRLAILFLLTLIAPAWSQNLSPPPNSTVYEGQPVISATFNQDIGRARIWVDGREFTDYADHRGRTITLRPPYTLDYGTHRVQVRTNYGRTAEWNFEIVQAHTNRRAGGQGWYNGGGGALTEVLNYGPAPGSVVTVTRPEVIAVFSGPVRNVRMTVDGVDVTRASRISNNRILWAPGYDLDWGQHNCVVTATASNGQAVRGDWNFVIRP